MNHNLLLPMDLPKQIALSSEIRAFIEMKSDPNQRPFFFQKDLRTAAIRPFFPKIKALIEEYDPESLEEFPEEELLAAFGNALSSQGDSVEMARSLERQYGYILNQELIDICDKVSNMYYDIENEIEAYWIKFHGKKSEFAIGDKVYFKPYSQKETVTGVISKIDDKRGYYTVFCESLGHVKEGIGTHGCVLPFEKVFKYVEN